MPDVAFTIGAKDRTKKALDSAGKGMDGFGSKFKSFGKTAALGLGVAGVAIGGLAAKMVTNVIKTGDELDKMAGRTGFAVEELSAMSFALEQSGSSLNTFERANRNLAKNLQDATEGTQTAVDKFHLLGLNYRELQKLSPNETFNAVADAIARIPNPAQRAALAGELLGQKAGPELLNLVAQGSEGIKALTDEAAELGRVMSTETATDAAEAGDAINALKSVFQGAAVTAAGSLLPAVTSVAKLLAEKLKPVLDRLLPVFSRLVEALLPALGPILDGIVLALNKVVVPAIELLASALETDLGAAIAAAVVGLIAVNAALTASPWGVIALAVVAAATAIIAHWEPIKGFFLSLWDTFRGWGDWLTSVFAPVWDVLKAAATPYIEVIKVYIEIVKGAINIGMGLVDFLTGALPAAWTASTNFVKGAINTHIALAEGLGNAYIGAINAIIKAWNSLDFRIPSVKIPIPFGPDINFGGWTIGTPNIPTLPTLTVPRLGEGGYVAKPTLAIVGDAPGGEYVTPARQMQSQPINIRLQLELDGQQLAGTIRQTVNEGVRAGGLLVAAELV